MKNVNNELINEIKKSNNIINFGIYCDDLRDEIKIREYISAYNGKVSEGSNSDSRDVLSYISCIKEKSFNNAFLINFISNEKNPQDISSIAEIIDGLFFVVDSLNGFNQKHEEILNICISNGIRPLLLINNIEKLIKNNNLTVIEFQEIFLSYLADFNKMISNITDDEKYFVDIQDGSLSFGSVCEDWLLNTPLMIYTGVTLFDVVLHHRGIKKNSLFEKIPFSECLMEMVMRYFENSAKVSQLPY